jgi:uncharacterized protein YndB with AHSA1/START domain
MSPLFFWHDAMKGHKLMKPIEHSITIHTPPSTIFRIYQAVEQWHTWDPDTKSARLDGPFAVGTRGHLTPAKGKGVPIELVAVEPDQAFTVRGWIPGFEMRFEHLLQAHGGATEVTHRVSFSGWLAWLFGPMVGRGVDKGLPHTLASLKRLAESQAN